MKSTTGSDAAVGDGRQAPTSRTSGAARIACTAIACVLAASFLISMRRYYHQDTGFTSLIGFPVGQGYEAPRLAGVPHYQYPGAGVYDGQFYAQRALDPLLRDPLTDRAMDSAPFRARRILFSWTAYLAGLGRPARILDAYALQNVVAWFILAGLLARWLPPSTPRGLAAWTACLFSHGLLWSVRFALLDGPSLALTVWAVRLAEQGRAVASAAVAGVNGLGRETNLLGVMAQPLPRSRREWLRLAATAVIVVSPLLIWEDYLRSIYRSTIFAGADAQTMLPGVAFARELAAAAKHASFLDLCILGPLAIQAAYIVVRARSYRQPWWRVGAGYVLLLLVLDHVLVTPATGAITRVLLPLTVAFNVLLMEEAQPWRFWPLLVAGNLHLIPARGIL
jgi:hypothetical protein